MGILIVTLIAVVVVLIITFALIADKNRQAADQKRQATATALRLTKHLAEKERLKTAYELALTGIDKKTALDAGREFMRFNREDHLSIYDEMALANDLAAMKI